MSSTAKDESCKYCGGYHTGVCPRIEAIKYYPNGEIKEIKLWPQFGELSSYYNEPKVDIKWGIAQLGDTT